jgi:hypothetical protein
MRRGSGAVFLALLAVIGLSGNAGGAMTVVVAVSPSEGVVGRPVEVLLRTFVPMGADDALPPVPYPVGPGLRNVLYPFPEYPFDVVARAGDRTTVQIGPSLDPADPTLWRGVFVPTKTGEWTVIVRNFPPSEPGASVRLSVVAGPDEPPVGAILVGALVAGSIAGFLFGRAMCTRRMCG